MNAYHYAKHCQVQPLLLQSLDASTENLMIGSTSHLAINHIPPSDSSSVLLSFNYLTFYILLRFTANLT